MYYALIFVKYYIIVKIIRRVVVGIRFLRVNARDDHIFFLCLRIPFKITPTQFSQLLELTPHEVDCILIQLVITTQLY